jgi:hypothetical protein
MVVCKYNIRRMPSSCFGSQHGTEAEWMCEFEVSVFRMCRPFLATRLKIRAKRSRNRLSNLTTLDLFHPMFR